MADPHDGAAKAMGVPRCECGYECRGATPTDRIRDAQRHAREAHGIEVSADQVLASQAPATEQGGAA